MIIHHIGIQLFAARRSLEKESGVANVEKCMEKAERAVTISVLSCRYCSSCWNQII